MCGKIWYVSRLGRDEPPPSGTRGRLIWDARIREKLSQDALAEKLGTTRQVVIGWEREGRLPQARHRAGLQQLLGLTEQDLMVPRRGGLGALWEAVRSVESRLDALESERGVPAASRFARGRGRG